MRLIRVMLAAMFIAAPAAGQRAGAYFTRLDFKELTEGQRNIYAAGVSDALTMGTLAGYSEKRQGEIAACLQDKKITNVQIALTATSIVNDEPEHLHWAASSAVIEAIAKICAIPWK